MSDELQQGKAEFTPYLQETYARLITSEPQKTLVQLLKDGQVLMEDHAQRIKELEEQLKSERKLSDENVVVLDDLCKSYRLRIYTLESLLTECMRVMKLYINVPEFDDLQARWEQLKGQ